jgi:hypothetical protein
LKSKEEKETVLKFIRFALAMKIDHQNSLKYEIKHVPYYLNPFLLEFLP